MALAALVIVVLLVRAAGTAGYRADRVVDDHGSGLRA